MKWTSILTVIFLASSAFANEGPQPQGAVKQGNAPAPGEPGAAPMPGQPGSGRNEKQEIGQIPPVGPRPEQGNQPPQGRPGEVNPFPRPPGDFNPQPGRERPPFGPRPPFPDDEIPPFRPRPPFPPRCRFCPFFPVCRCRFRWQCLYVPRTCFTCPYYACRRPGPFF
jgi:hypothetical protein